MDIDETNYEDKLGFISRDGTFHSVDYACHEEFAWDYLDDHPDEIPDQDEADDTLYKTDVLVYQMGWILIHNPGQRPYEASIDYSVSKRLTLAQKKTLFDYLEDNPWMKEKYSRIISSD